MVIHLAPAAGGGASRGFSIGGLQTFELLHDVQMHLVPGAGGMMPLDPQHRGQQPKPQVVPTAANVVPPASPPNNSAATQGMVRVLRPNLPSPIPDAPVESQSAPAPEREA